MRNVWQDVRYGVRSLVRQPGFTIVAILTLALGIGAATVIFSVIQNALLDPAPYADLDRIALVQIRDAANPNAQGGRTAFEVPEFLEYQEQNHVFEEVIGGSFEDVLLSNGEGTLQFDGGIVTPNTMKFLGVPALLGRGIVASDGEPSAPAVFVMSYKMWVAHFNMDPAVVGRSFVLNGIPTTCVGVMPQRYTKQNADLWRPITLSRATNMPRNSRFFVLQAKLKPGVSFEQATSEMDVVARRVAKLYPDNYPERFTVRVISWLDSIVASFRGTLYTLFGAVGVLLLIACSNVANMLLARAAAREKEMAVRTAIGASQWLLIRQLLIESLLLALGGAALGCLFAYFGIGFVVGLIPDGLIPHEVVIRLNVPVLLFSLAVAVLTAVIFGLVPAMQTVKKNMVEPLKDSGRGIVGGFRRGKLRSTLVVVEVALSLVLLTGAGLLMRNFTRLQSQDLGFDPNNIMVARLPLPRGQYVTAAAKQQFFDTVLTRMRSLPGVVAVTETSTLPPYGGIGTDVDITGKTHSEKWRAIFQLSSEGYFDTLRMRMLRGRAISADDVRTARKVAVVNQTLVKQFLANDDPIGRQIRLKQLEQLPPDDKVADPVFEIVGVVSDAKNRGIVDPPQPEIFVPYTITGAFERGIMVRTQGNPELLLNAARQQIWATDRGVAITLTGSLMTYLGRFSYAQPRFSLVILMIFAGVGLVLVAVGVYSVIAYTVSRQTREIGIRIALGASRADVLRMVGAMGLRLIGIGSAIGLLTSFAATRLIASQLSGVSPRDPLTLLAVVGLMIGVGLAACYVPANRAAKVDPMVALRVE